MQTMPGYPVSKSAGVQVLIVCLSVISGIATFGISVFLLWEIANYSGFHISSSSTSRDSTTPIVILSIGILSVVLQIVISAAFWFTNKYKQQRHETKSLIYGFAYGQSFVQIVLLLCLGFVTYKYFNSFESNFPGETAPNSSSEAKNRNHSTGHVFWIILSVNVVFHIAAILYLVFYVIRANDWEEMEEMKAVVVHRRVPSRIPSQRSKVRGQSKRQGALQ